MTMNTVFLLLSVQSVLGAFDNLWHHEWQARLPQRVSARRELGLHAAREALYGLVFLGLGWFEWHGAMAGVLALVLAAEVAITLADFLEEDRGRRLPPFERLLHTVLTISYGAFVALMVPVLLGWARLDTALHWHPNGWVSWLFTLYGVGVLAWSVRNARAVVRLGRLAALHGAPSSRARAPASHGGSPAVLVTGATGFVGSALVGQLVAEGRRVIVLSRDARQAQALFGPGSWVVEHLDQIPGETRIDAVVNLAGARVLGRPWTAARRRQLLGSRVDVTVAVVQLLRRLQQPPQVLVSASAVGYYGAANQVSGAVLTEAGPPRPGQFQSDLCAAIEHEAQRAQGLGVRVVRLRFGVVLGRGDGAYPMLALAARWGLGARLGNGRQPAPWIHLDDAVGLIRHAMAHRALEGAVNAVAPDTPSQADFSRALARSLGRGLHLRVPEQPLRWLMGEMSTLLLDGQNVVPQAALRAGYRFRFPALGLALQDLAGR
jgi:uncharacterized protein (TIGR01777 family)